MNTYQKLRKKCYDIIYPDGIPLNKLLDLL